MDKLEYLLYAIKKDLLSNINWYYTFMTIFVKNNFKNKYMELVNGKLYVIMDEGKVELSYIKDKPVFQVIDIIKLPKNTINNDSDVTTTMGIMIMNYILLYKTIGTRVTYKNEPFDIGKLEKDIGGLLNRGIITVSEYKKFNDNAIFLEKFSRIVTISATERNITPPDNLSSFKKKTLEEMEDNYGPEWFKKAVLVVEYEDKLKNFYNEYVSNDPSEGVFLSGKIKNNAGLKKYLTYGLAIGIQDPADIPPHVNNSLIDGYPKDKKQLAGIFDSPRFASYSRGKSTAIAGYAGKQILRAITSIKISKKDCNVTYGKKIKITKDIATAIVGRYIIVNKKTKLLETIDDVNKYLDTVIEIRSPQYCKSPDNTICGVCAGTLMANYENGVSLVIADIGSNLLGLSMAKMHNTAIFGMEVDVISGVK